MSHRSGDVTARWVEFDVDIDGRHLHVHRAGRVDGPTLVLAHGLSDNGRCWWQVVEALADDLDLVMIDARNHGGSSTVIGASATLADDVAAVIDGLGLSQPAAMGHSVGAQTMADLVANRPGIVSRLVLVDPPFRLDQESGANLGPAQREAIRSWLGSFTTMTEDQLFELGRQQHADWPEDEYPTWVESKQQVRSGAADDLSGGSWGTTVAAIGCPTLLVHGDPARGGIVTAEVAQRIVELNPLVSSRCISDGGHNIHRENFGSFIEVVRDFLGLT